jgi:hypothetical protein
MKKKDERKRVRRVLRCPICFSSRNDLYLGGKLSLQMYKCLDCGFVGVGFIEVDQGWSPPKYSD